MKWASYSLSHGRIALTRSSGQLVNSQLNQAISRFFTGCRLGTRFFAISGVMSVGEASACPTSSPSSPTGAVSVEKPASDQVGSVLVSIFACATVQLNDVAHSDFVNSVPSRSQIMVMHDRVLVAFASLGRFVQFGPPRGCPTGLQAVRWGKGSVFRTRSRPQANLLGSDFAGRPLH